MKRRQFFAALGAAPLAAMPFPAAAEMHDRDGNPLRPGDKIDVYDQRTDERAYVGRVTCFNREKQWVGAGMHRPRSRNGEDGRYAYIPRELVVRHFD